MKMSARVSSTVLDWFARAANATCLRFRRHTCSMELVLAVNFH